MKVGKKMLESRIEEFCKNSSELLQNIHVRCGDNEGGSGNGKPKRGRKKSSKRK